MTPYPVYIWKKAPFLRLLISLTAGIILEWEFHFPVFICWSILVTGSIGLIIFFFIPFFHRYQFGFASGFAGFLAFLALGALDIWYKDIRHQPNWFGNIYRAGDAIVLHLDQPLEEKTKSFKAEALAGFIVRGEKTIPVKGKVILYFKKRSEGNKGFLANQLGYGTSILLKKPLQEIKNTGNPGEFDYKRSELFRGFTHESFLDSGEFVLLSGSNAKWLDRFIYRSREKIINILRSSIPGEKERGLAEALLIGYKDDLDRELVSSYTHTGVVHIIAISGMHIGLIYWLLLFSFRSLFRKKLNWMKPLYIISGLWLFSLLAGAQPSVLRSALMFTCIVIGENLGKRTSIYNSLALSAFLLLCYDPFWLWDLGFQLSYAAVLSIVIFHKPIYHCFYFQNKLLDHIWKLNAVTFAAQILTLPLSIYHFHQFPNYFLLTNLVAVPLSSLIVLGEILLCTFSFFPFLAGMIGKLLSFLIHLMNLYIERIESMPYSLWNGLEISIPQTILLFLLIAGLSGWMGHRSVKGLKGSLLAILVFLILRSQSFIKAERQEKLIVFNLPQHSRIDFILGRKYISLGDKDLSENDPSFIYHIKPSRIAGRLGNGTRPGAAFINENLVCIQKKHILIYTGSNSFTTLKIRPVVDLVIVTGTSALKLSLMAAAIDIREMVFDSSVPSWKVKQWKKDCDSLHIPFHDVNESGAFVMKLN